MVLLNLPHCRTRSYQDPVLGKTKYYIRELPSTFVVGQLFPQAEVPKPRGRKLLNMVKNHMTIWMYRQVIKNKRNNVEINRTENLLYAFPGTAEAQLRQRFKGFAKFSKKSSTGGTYELEAALSRTTIDDKFFQPISPNHVSAFDAEYSIKATKSQMVATIDMSGGGISCVGSMVE